MKKEKFYGAIAVFLFGILTAHCQADTSLLTFEEARQRMYNLNPAILKAQKEIEQKQYEKDVKRGMYLPKVSLSAKAVAMSDPLHLDLTEVRDAITPIYDVLGNYGVFDGVPYVNPETGEVLAILDQQTSTGAVRQQLLEGEEHINNAEWDQIIQEKTFASVSADVVWPIFTGGKIASANKAAREEIVFSQEEMRKTEGELLSELVTRYYGLVLSSQVTEVMHSKYSSMLEHQKNAEKLYSEGMIAKIELLSAKVATSDAQREYKKAINMENTIRSGLSATLTAGNDTVLIPASTLFINKNVPNLQYWTGQTINSNPQLKQIISKKNLVDIKTSVSKREYLPTVALMGTYNLTDYDLSPYMPDWVIGAGLSWTIFDGMSRNKEIKANKTLQDQVVYIEEKAQDDLNTYVVKLYNDLLSCLMEIEELQNTIELATEYSESTEKAFREGMATSSSVEEAQSKLSQAKALRLKSFYEYDVTLAALLQVAGIPEQFTAYCTGENTITETIK